METVENPTSSGQWYLFLHQVPPAPAYFRVRVLRQLNQLGALAIKKSAYLLPASDETFEDLQWLRKSILSDGGDAWIFQSDAVAGHTNEELRETFSRMRGEEYTALAVDARALLEELRGASTRRGNEDPEEQSVTTRIRKLMRRLEAIRRIDYFGAPQQQEVTTLMNEIDRSQQISTSSDTAAAAAEYHGRRWVTRRGIKVDRMASAWLIRRFIDPSPEFTFVDPAAYRHTSRDLRFDMFEGEFTHEGNKCTFEVLVDRFGLADSGLSVLAEIVHDIDLKEPVHRRNETAGVVTMIDGIVRRNSDDRARLDAAMGMFDSLYESFRR